MRLASYNVAWFNALFDDQGDMTDGHEWSSRYNITKDQQADALGKVFQAMDADAVMVIEAPDTGSKRSTHEALSTFAETYDLRTRAIVMGFANDTQQEIALLYDPTVLTVEHDPQSSPDAPRFDQEFSIDLDIDGQEDTVIFSKPPLELAAKSASGRAFRIIGAHLKSKAPHGARSDEEARTISIANRRKQLAQAIWLRRRAEAHLVQGDSLILMGDLNDGPGLDQYENLFGRSSVEILIGDAPHDLYDAHAQDVMTNRFGPRHSSARFFIRQEKRYLQALLDYIMVSPDLKGQAGPWRILHPFDDALCWSCDDLRQALLTASDHFPVVLDIDL